MDLGVLEGQTREDYFFNSIFDPSVNQCNIYIVVEIIQNLYTDTAAADGSGTLHPKIPRLVHCINRFWGITESIFKIESFMRCQNDRTNGANIWYFHHHCVLFKFTEHS